MSTFTDHFAHTPAVLRGTSLLVALLMASALVRQDIPGDSQVVNAGSETTVDPELNRAAERGSLCSSSNPTGVGLRGEYFAKEKFQGSPLLVRTDAGIDFDANFDWRSAPGVSQAPKSVRWTGWVRPPVTGRYKFHVQAEGATVTVARKVLTGLSNPDDAYVELHAGRYAPVVIEMSPVPTGAAERVRFEWTTPYGARFVVPQALLFTPNESLVATRP
jgi:hypothetical protein